MAVQNIYPLSPVEDLPDQVTGFKIERDSGPDAELIWDDQNEYWEFRDKNGKRRVTREGAVETKSGDFAVSEEDRNKVFLVSTSSSGTIPEVTLTDSVDEGWSASFVNDGDGAFRFTTDNTTELKAKGNGVLTERGVAEVYFDGTAWRGVKGLENVLKNISLALDIQKEVEDSGGEVNNRVGKVFVESQNEYWRYYPHIVDFETLTIDTISTVANDDFNSFSAVHASKNEQVAVFHEGNSEIYFYDKSTKNLEFTESGPLDDGSNQMPINESASFSGGGIYATITDINESTGEEFIILAAVDSNWYPYFARYNVDTKTTEVVTSPLSSYNAFEGGFNDFGVAKRKNGNYLTVLVDDSVGFGGDEVLGEFDSSFSLINTYSLPNISGPADIFHYFGDSDSLLYVSTDDNLGTLDSDVFLYNFTDNSSSKYITVETTSKTNLDNLSFDFDFYFDKENGTFYGGPKFADKNGDDYTNFSINDIDSSLQKDSILGFDEAMSTEFDERNLPGVTFYDRKTNIINTSGELLLKVEGEKNFSELDSTFWKTNTSPQEKSQTFNNKDFLGLVSKLPNVDRETTFESYVSEEDVFLIKDYDEQSQKYLPVSGDNTTYLGKSGKVKYKWDGEEWNIKGSGVENIVVGDSQFVDRQSYDFNLGSNKESNFKAVEYSSYRQEVYIVYLDTSSSDIFLGVYDSQDFAKKKEINITTYFTDSLESLRDVNLLYIIDTDTLFVHIRNSNDAGPIEIDLDNGTVLKQISTPNTPSVFQWSYDRNNQRILAGGWNDFYYDVETENIVQTNNIIPANVFVYNEFREKVYGIDIDNNIVSLKDDLETVDEVLYSKDDKDREIVGFDERFIYFLRGEKFNLERQRMDGFNLEDRYGNKVRFGKKGKFNPGMVGLFYKQYQQGKRFISEEFTDITYNENKDEFYAFVGDGRNQMNEWDKNSNVFVLNPPEDDSTARGHKLRKKTLDETLNYSLRGFDEILTMENNSDKFVTILLEHKESISIGTEFTIRNEGSGVLELVEDGSSIDTVKIKGNYRFLIDDGAEATLRKVDKNTWVTEGDIYKETNNGFEKK